ncbi:hypothetical protein CSOJ01_13978 [Colletotrichum sojae]|uniref:DUF7587 domain-containing protein n=1 Tax=Colletotrichum sojae TaxID=2175907 RepID=A0A8H6IRU4_9PEZI|nr:hypothetical protein CSOJ01_13978 [Colletotrichum sojae]
MPPVPVQDVMVAKFAPNTTRIEENTSEVLGWLTKSTLDKRVPRGLCLGPEGTEKVEAVFPGVLQPMNSARDLRKHLRHQCREPSPFLSATSKFFNAREIAQRYERKGHGGVKIIRFETDGPHWNHKVQRLWYPRDVLRQLGVSCDGKSNLEDEYLFEHSIPEESINECTRLAQFHGCGPVVRLFGVIDKGGLKMTPGDIWEEQKREAAEEAKKRKARAKAEKKKEEEKREKDESKRKRSDNERDELNSPDDQPDSVEAASQSQVETGRRGSKRNKAGKPQRPGDVA